MARIQLALNVSNLDEAVDFYSKLFDTEPAKRRPGYANFAVEDPPLKLVLIEGGGVPGSINHLGVEEFSPEAVAAASVHLRALGLETVDEHETTCCYAVQDKVWVSGPDSSRWEVYTVLADASDAVSIRGATDCCTASSLDELQHVSTDAVVTQQHTSCC